MSRVFLYARVSKDDLVTDNQIEQVAAAGIVVQPNRVVSEVVSGSTPMSQRPGFAKLLDRLEDGDTVVVTKLDRLGRDAVDVTTTVRAMAARGIRVRCLALGDMDLTSAAGLLTMQVLNAVAQFERDLIIERTNAGLARAKAAGVAVGRPPVVSAMDIAAIKESLSAGKSVASTAKAFGVSRQTVSRIRDGQKVGVVKAGAGAAKEVKNDVADSLV
ncbi:recombinase family protein [Beijerinckia mobilis]|uniref:recombinase family protein n=1 Tax=Beijerinckia mobilis TaxID=231434 RepID=UPI000A04A49D|nr:recombinase family protein [Beijerinckia mobilis]